MKVVFLDFDGVINAGSGRWLRALVERLNRITDATGAKIIVHSSWRTDRPVELLRHILQTYHYGIPVTGEVYDACPFPHGKKTEGGIWVTDGGWASFKDGIESNDERCIAIQRWLNEHPGVVTRYVILDDSTALGHFVGTPEFICTRTHIGLPGESRSNDGLTDEHVRRAIYHLNGVTW
jgi:hypothetical protein